MKVLHLNEHDSRGGAARAFMRLLAGERELGLDAEAIVQKKTTASPYVHGPTGLSLRLKSLRALQDKLPLRQYQLLPGTYFSPSGVPSNVIKSLDLSKVDLIHLHWLAAGFVSVEDLGNLGTTPAVWTLHDMWAFTGGCHTTQGCDRYQNQCGECPMLNSKRTDDLSRQVFDRKMRAWEGLNLHITAPSTWLAGCAAKGPITGRFPISVIPNGLNTQSFCPGDRQEARQRLGIPSTDFAIGFAGMPSDPNKGGHFVKAALESSPCPQEWSLWAIGGGIKQDTPHNCPVHEFGSLASESSLVDFYRSMDVVLMPSVQESFGQIASESLACSTPVVAFGATGLLDIVEHNISGYLAKPYDPIDLRTGIDWVYQHPEKGTLGESGRQKVVREFDQIAVARKFIELYEQILG